MAIGGLNPLLFRRTGSGREGLLEPLFVGCQLSLGKGEIGLIIITVGFGGCELRVGGAALGGAEYLGRGAAALGLQEGEKARLVSLQAVLHGHGKIEGRLLGGVLAGLFRNAGKFVLLLRYPYQ